MADFNVTECVIENVNGAAFLRPQKSYSIVIDTVSTTSSIPISANTQVVRLATPSSCHFRLGAGATTSDAMIPAGEVVDFAVQPDGGTSYLSVIEATTPTDIGGGGVGDSGLESVNVETLAGDKTITSVDARIHILNGGGASRNVTLDASLHVVGTHIRIASANDGNPLTIKNSAGTTLAIIFYEQTFEAVYDATGWKTLYNIPYARYATTVDVGFQSGVDTTMLSIGTAHRGWVTATGVGIGASPSSLFHVTAAGDAGAFKVDNTTGTSSFLSGRVTVYNNNDVGAIQGKTLAGAARWQIVDTDNIDIYSVQNLPMRFFTNSVKRLEISNGTTITQVGTSFIGYSASTVNAAKSWAIYGLDYPSTGNPYIIGYGTGSGYYDVIIGSADMGTGWVYIKSAFGNNIICAPQGTGIGSNPSSLFHVTAAGNANALRVDNTTGCVGIGNAPVSYEQVSITANAATNALRITGRSGYWLVECQHGSGYSGLLHDASDYASFVLTTGSNVTHHKLTSAGYYNFIGSEVTLGTPAYATAGMLVDMSTATIKKALGIPSLTTTERDVLTGVNRMLIYNSTTDKFQGYAGGAWVDLH